VLAAGDQALAERVGDPVVASHEGTLAVCYTRSDGGHGNLVLQAWNGSWSPAATRVLDEGEWIRCSGLAWNGHGWLVSWQRATGMGIPITTVQLMVDVDETLVPAGAPFAPFEDIARSSPVVMTEYGHGLAWAATVGEGRQVAVVFRHDMVLSPPRVLDLPGELVGRLHIARWPYDPTAIALGWLAGASAQVVVLREDGTILQRLTWSDRTGLISDDGPTLMPAPAGLGVSRTVFERTFSCFAAQRSLQLLGPDARPLGEPGWTSHDGCCDGVRGPAPAATARHVLVAGSCSDSTILDLLECRR
jgi:hypothetical protein